MKLKLQSGFSVIEIFIVVGILALLTGIIFGTFVSYRKSEALNKDTETIIEVLRQARSQTLSSQNASQYGVHFETGKVTLFTGTSYSAGVSTNQDFIISSTDTIITINLLGGGSSVIFKRLSGETDQTGTVVISSPTSPRTKTVTIYATGLVEIN